jgi:quercetin dioxygenase-like cupin family protein
MDTSAASSPNTSATAGFEGDGYLGPKTILAPEECAEVAAYLARRDLPEPPDWEKARAVGERFLYELSTRREILEPVAELLGEDVVLWGVSSVEREPGHVHPWHSDIESCGPEGGFVSVWVGIENTTLDSSLQLVPGSHGYGLSVQEARQARHLGRDDGTAGAILELALQHDAHARVLVPELEDGQALFFDGRLWHGTDNRSNRVRTALLLQFAAADRAVRIPDWSELEWPFRFRDARPPAILVHGTGRSSANRLVAPPPVSASERSRLGTIVHTFRLPVDADMPDPWQPFPAFRRRTAVCADMACHASVLAGGHSAHAPHAHDEEEILVSLHGECELVIASGPDDPAPRLERLAPGSFVYYPAGQHHTIRNPGETPIAYLMLKWRSTAVPVDEPLATRVVRVDDSPADGADAFATKPLLDGPTRYLDTLHSHLSSLEPGAGYEPHSDDYDVAIVTLEGVVETLGRQVRPWSIVYYAAGEPHGMRNLGSEAARYLVFELHRSSRLADRLRRRLGRG